MQVWDSDSPEAEEWEEIESLTGYSPYLPDNIVSRGPEIYITFVTDETETASGFKIKYDAGKYSFG